MSIKDLNKLPENLPVPVDDGACDHLLNFRLPSIQLKGTSGAIVDLSKIEETVVVFFYPMNGKPESPPMIGWMTFQVQEVVHLKFARIGTTI